MLQCFLLFVSIFSIANGGALLNLPRNWRNEKIIGQEADITEFPYQAALFYGSGFVKGSCGGVIISPDIILSTAMFSYLTLPGNWWLRVGSTNKQDGGQLRYIKSIYSHPRFSLSGDYDISVFYLFDPIIIDGITTKIIPLAAQDAQIPVGSIGIMSGWGRTQTNDPMLPELLRKTSLQIIPQQTCIDAHVNTGKTISSRMFCAYYPQTVRTFCNGDEGGAFVVNGTVIGLASFSISCGSNGHPQVFTDVGSLRNWIDANM